MMKATYLKINGVDLTEHVDDIRIVRNIDVENVCSPVTSVIGFEFEATFKHDFRTGELDFLFLKTYDFRMIKELVKHHEYEVVCTRSDGFFVEGCRYRMIISDDSVDFELLGEEKS